ncbi:MAG: tRNA lysidine(34) synthetase TilS [bacterium]
MFRRTRQYLFIAFFYLYLKDKYNLKLGIFHLDHSIREDSYIEYELLLNYAKNFNIEIHSFKENVIKYAKNNKLNLEEAGRILRYNLAIKTLKKYNYSKIATAHNLNDLISSFFINFIKSNHYLNLFNLNPIFIFKDIKIIRPLLFIPKQEILKTLENNQINYIIDKTNLDIKYLRNYINLNFTNNFINNLLKKKNILKNYEFLKDIINFIQNYKDSITNIPKIKYILDIYFIEFKEINNKFLIVESLFFNLKKFLNNIYNNLKNINIKYENIKHLVEYDNEKKVNIIKDWFLIKELNNFNNKIFILFKSNFNFYYELDLSKSSEYLFKICNIEIKIKIKNIYNLEEFLKENILEEYIKDLKEKFKTSNYAFGFCFNKIVIRNWRKGDYFRPYGLNGKKQKLKKFFINNKFKEYEKNRTLIFEDEAGIFLIFNYISNIKRGRDIINNKEVLKISKEKKEIKLIEIYINEDK